MSNVRKGEEVSRELTKMIKCYNCSLIFFIQFFFLERKWKVKYLDILALIIEEYPMCKWLSKDQPSARYNS